MTRDQIDNNCICIARKCGSCNHILNNLLKENLELKEWKAKASPFLEDEYNVIKQGLEAECREDAVHPNLRSEWEEMYKTLTELLEK